MEVCLERSGSLGEANFETSLHVIVWNKLINRQRVGGCSHHACYVDLSVLWRNEGGGGGFGRTRRGRDARATARPCETPLGRAPPPA